MMCSLALYHGSIDVCLCALSGIALHRALQVNLWEDMVTMETSNMIGWFVITSIKEPMGHVEASGGSWLTKWGRQLTTDPVQTSLSESIYFHAGWATVTLHRFGNDRCFSMHHQHRVVADVCSVSSCVCVTHTYTPCFTMCKGLHRCHLDLNAILLSSLH